MTFFPAQYVIQTFLLRKRSYSGYPTCSQLVFLLINFQQVGSLTFSKLVTLHCLCFAPRNKQHTTPVYYYSFLNIFLKVFYFQRGEGREKEREKNINVWLPLILLKTWPATQACTLTGNRTGDPLFRMLVLNSLNHTSQGSVWLNLFFKLTKNIFNINSNVNI